MDAGDQYAQWSKDAAPTDDTEHFEDLTDAPLAGGIRKVSPFRLSAGADKGGSCC